MSRPHDITDIQAARELARVGAAALPDIDELAPMHLHAIDEAIRAMALPTTPKVAMARRAGPLRSRRAVIAFAAAMFVAVPSMAFAGVLPDSVQHAAATVASNVGVDLPDPAADRAEEATSERGSERGGDDAGTTDSNAQEETGKGLGADTRGTVPGKPEPGEVRGNRFGQVEGGPDQGRAGDAQAARPPANDTPPSTSQRPTSPPGQSADHGGGSGGGGGTSTGTPPSSNAGGGGGGKPADTPSRGKGH